MEKHTATTRRRATHAADPILGQVQSGLLLGFGVVVLLIVFGAGVLVGMWYQANEYTSSYAEVTAPTSNAPGGPQVATDEQKMTFYSTLRTHEPAPATLAVPPAPVPAAPEIAPQAALSEPPSAVAPVAEAPVSSSSPPPPPPPVASRHLSPAVTAYSVQVGSFRAAAEAEKLQEQLLHKGYEARIQLFMVPGRGPWYRVRVGSFTQRVAAEQAARRLRTHERIPAIVAVEVR